MNAAWPATPVIRTPDQRLRVFVSSTLVELADERQVAAAAISALGSPWRPASARRALYDPD